MLCVVVTRQGPLISETSLLRHNQACPEAIPDNICVGCSFLASGSWDYTARIWSRASLRCRAVITFPDWLWDLRAAGGNLLVAAGACAHVVDLTTGQRLRM